MPLYQPDKMVTIEFYRVILEFLSLVFLEEPTAEIVAQLARGNPFGDWPVDSGSSDLKQGLDTLEHFCATWQEAELQALRQDYRRLFMKADKALASPFESEFLSEDDSRPERQALEVRSIYERYGLQVPMKHQIPDDHLSFELQFMATLCDQLVNAWRIGEPAAINRLFTDGLSFLDRHLLLWLGRFSDRVLQCSQTDFYRGMALVARASVGDLREYLQYLS